MACGGGLTVFVSRFTAGCCAAERRPWQRSAGCLVQPCLVQPCPSFRRSTRSSRSGASPVSRCALTRGFAFGFRCLPATARSPGPLESFGSPVRRCSRPQRAGCGSIGQRRGIRPTLSEPCSGCPSCPQLRKCARPGILGSLRLWPGSPGRSCCHPGRPGLSASGNHPSACPMPRCHPPDGGAELHFAGRCRRAWPAALLCRGWSPHLTGETAGERPSKPVS